MSSDCCKRNFSEISINISIFKVLLTLCWTTSVLSGLASWTPMMLLCTYSLTTVFTCTRFASWVFGEHRILQKSQVQTSQGPCIWCRSCIWLHRALKGPVSFPAQDKGAPRSPWGELHSCVPFCESSKKEVLWVCILNSSVWEALLAFLPICSSL